MTKNELLEDYEPIFEGNIEDIVNTHDLCVITNRITKSKTKNIPLSREGRRLVQEYKDKVSDLREDTGLPFIITTKMAIDDLKEGRDIVEDFYKRTQEIEDEIENKEAESRSENSTDSE